MDWENHFEKNPIQKIEKTVKIKVKMPHVGKKPQARKRLLVQTSFSHFTLKLERKNFTLQNHPLFRSTSCFGVTKITTPIWLQKSWKWVNRSKKRQHPNTIQILWILKTNRRPIIDPAVAVRLLISNYRREVLAFRLSIWHWQLPAKKLRWLESKALNKHICHDTTESIESYLWYFLDAWTKTSKKICG